MLLDRIPSTVWALACAALIAGAGIQRGEASKARADLSDYRAQVAQATARAEAKARDKEAVLRGEAEHFRTAFEKESQNAETAKNRLLAGIRAGTERLSIAAHCRAPAGQAGADSAAAPSAADGQRADIDPTAAAAIVAIAADGDAAIIERNACIAQYNQVRQLMAED